MRTIHIRLVQVSIILTFFLLLLGGLVHNTGSSLACPDWPLCYGQVFPKMEGGILIEHSHRLLASAVGILTVLNFLIAWKRRLGERLIKLSFLSLFFVVCQGILGGITVIYKLPTIVSTFHLGLSNIYFCSLLFFYFNLRKFEDDNAFSFSKNLINQKQLIAHWNADLKNWTLLSGLLVYSQMLLGAFIRHSGIGTSCGVGLQNSLLCFDSQLNQLSLWPSLAPLKVHFFHRLLGVIVGFVIFISQIKIYLFSKKYLKQMKLLPFGWYSLVPILLVLIQIYLGIMTVSTGLGVFYTTLHLGFASLLLASLFFSYLLLRLWEEKLFGKLLFTSFADYVDLTKPKLSLLVIVSASVGLILAPGQAEFFSAVITVLFSALLIAGASSLNCYLEVDVDKLMDRTKNRPLPAGRMKKKNALIFGLSLIMISLPMLAWFSNLLTASLGAIACILYLLAYTPLKKKTTLALFIGAIPGATPIVMGFTSITNHLDVLALCLFLILFVWQLPHFLAISLYCQKDYERAAIKILPSIKGSLHTKWKIFVYTIFMIVISVLPTLLNFRGNIYLAASIALGLIFLLASLQGFFKDRRSGLELKWAKNYFYCSLFYLPLLLSSLLFFK